VTVLSLPHYAGSNPYQRELNGALQKQGTRFLHWPRQARLSHIRGLIANRVIPDILHQQWIHVDTLRPTLARSLVATALFFLQIGLLRLLGVKIIWTLHNKVNHDGVFPRLDRWIRRAMFRAAHAVIVHSGAAARDACAHLAVGNRARARVRVVPHAAYCGTYPETAGRREARAAFGLEETHFCYGSIGRLQPYKGIEELVEVFRQLPGGHLRLLAAGPVHSARLMRWLDEQRAADARIILFPERIPEDRLQACFAAADAVVYPFRDQLTSGSVMAAASFGRALVLPDVPSLCAGLPPRGRVLFHPGRRPSLLAALHKVSTCDTAAMGAANRRATESPEMSWETMARRTLEVYRAVLA
jgi:glycosyltransferase involved in cell wall biosynthesis